MAEISLAIPVYNSNLFLGEMFACLRLLDPAPTEIVFLDDASTDDSLSRVEAFAAAFGNNAKVRVLRNVRNGGIAAAYSRLAREACGEWIQLLDADDLLVESDYFAQAQPFLTVENDLVITAIDSNSRLIAVGSRILNWLVPRYPPKWWPLLGSFATRSGMLYRRQILVDHPFPDPAYPGSDVIHLLELRSTNRCLYLRHPRVFYRVHGNARSSLSCDYSTFRRKLARFDRLTRFAHGLDLGLRKLGQRWAR